MAALCFSPNMPFTNPRISAAIRQPQSQTARIALPGIKATPTQEATTVDYSSLTSVFPAEACETIGGDACTVEMFPEVKLQPEARSNPTVAGEDVDREYLEYNEPKTVFPGEACDDLGGEFCEPDYQTGVFVEGVQSK